MTITWWMWLIAGVLLAGMAASLAFLSLSAGSAYGANYERLVQVKNQYDPLNLFRLNNNIPPTT